MKRKNLAKKLTALVMTGAMVMSMGMTAFAVEPGDDVVDVTDVDDTDDTDDTDEVIDSNVYIYKKLNKPENVILPNVTYNFSVEFAGETTKVPADRLGDADKAVSLKSSDGSKADTAIAKQDSEGTGIGETQYTYAEKLLVDIDESKFKAPGTYTYTIKELAPTPAYEGLSTAADLTLTVVYGYEEISTGVFAETPSILFKGFASNAKGEKNEGYFVDDYGTEGENGKLNNLSLTKKLTGNQADPGRSYSFTITITPASANRDKTYSIQLPGQNVVQIGNGNTQTFSLTKDQTAYVYGLSEGDTYTITEENYASDGYETSWLIATSEGTEENSTAKHEVTTGTKNIKSVNSMTTEAVTFTNKKDNPTPTGIAMTFAPYIVMVAVAGVFAVMFLRKKREDF